MKARMIEWGVATLVLGIFLFLYSEYGGQSLHFLLILTSMIMLAGLAIQIFGARNIEIKRIVPPVFLTAGQDAEVVVHIQFQSLLPLPWLTVTDLFTGGTYCKLILPGFSRSFTYSYTLSKLPRGIITFQQCHAAWGGLFGWFGRSYILASHEKITVLPIPMLISRDQVRTSQSRGDGVSEVRDPYLASGTWGPEARDYVVGDPLNRIHWKSSARRGRLQTILPEQEGNNTLYIILDPSLKGYDLPSNVNNKDGYNLQSLFEYAVSVAAGLLFEAEEAGVDTELVCDNDNHDDYYKTQHSSPVRHTQHTSLAQQTQQTQQTQHKHHGSRSYLSTLATIKLEEGDSLLGIVESVVRYTIQGSHVALVTGELNGRITGVASTLQGSGLAVDIYCVQPTVSFASNDYVRRVTHMGMKVYDVQGNLESAVIPTPVDHPTDRMIWKGGAPYAHAYPESTQSTQSSQSPQPTQSPQPNTAQEQRSI
ncbi:uncharacterized protein (DUF58 family) [Paenibacillus sp. DS2015]|uniref:DUF58 domain-containing protein n=1 Tax=Paenibacillus sp. DS2015 TaxID=3373917 RepID=UPI003D2546E2